MDHVYYPVIGLLKSVFAAQGLRFTVTGAEHVPRVGGAVLAVNHTGYFDFAYAGNALLPRRRLIRFMAKEPIFKHPVAGPVSYTHLDVYKRQPLVPGRLGELRADGPPGVQRLGLEQGVPEGAEGPEARRAHPAAVRRGLGDASCASSPSHGSTVSRWARQDGIMRG